MPKILRQEWLWVVAWSLIILSVTSLPYLYGTMLSTPAHQFGGFVIGVEDGYSYLAKMRLGAEGSWRFYLFYTSEPHEGAYLFTFHLLLGKIAHWTGLSFVLVYHLARLVFGFFLLITLYYFTAFFTNLLPVRRVTFWFVSLGSGLGWLMVITGLMEQVGLPLDFYSPEAFTFHPLLGLPHLSLVQSLLLWGILFLLLAWERQQLKYAVLAGLVWFSMTLVAAFYIIIVGAVIGTSVLLRAVYRWRHQRVEPTSTQVMNLGMKRLWLEIGLALLALVIALPFPIYNLYIFTINPIFEVWAEQNVILSPQPVHYLLAFGLLIVLAAIGGWQEWQRSNERSLVLIGWCLVTPLLIYLPFNLQRRLTLGVQVALAILAGLGLWWLCYYGGELIKGRLTKSWGPISVGLILVLSLSNLLILAGTVLEVRHLSSPIFQPGAVVEAANWLGSQTTVEHVVLAAYSTGNYLPTRAAARVFVGHGPETVNSTAKIAIVSQFFAADQVNFRRQLVRDYSITHLFYGPAERALGEFIPSECSDFEKVYDNGMVQIYEVIALN